MYSRGLLRGTDAGKIDEALEVGVEIVKGAVGALGQNSLIPLFDTI